MLINRLGIYNVNNEFVKLGRNNILKFVQDTMIEKLESKGPNPLCEHNFENIPQITVEDDTVHGIYGDHTIRNTLGMLPDDSKQILGEFTCDWIYNNFKWYFDIFKYNK